MANGLVYAELTEFLKRELAEDGFSGCEVRVTPQRTEIIIRATRTDKVPLSAPLSAIFLCLSLPLIRHLAALLSALCSVLCALLTLSSNSLSL